MQTGPSHSLDLPIGSAPDFRGVIFPWCINSYEVKTKAFRFYVGPRPSLETLKTGIFPQVLFYMFQYYRDDQVYWLAPDSNGGVNFARRKHCGEGPSSYVEVTINADGRPSVKTVS